MKLVVNGSDVDVDDRHAQTPLLWVLRDVLGLDGTKFGCGGGFFLFILKNLGHSVTGLDTDRVPLFGELLELFGVRRVVYRIDAFEPLPDFGQQFDWITAFSIGFDRSRDTNVRWGVKEWDFLLRDLQRHLAPGGKIYLAVNPLPNGEYLTPEVRDFFSSCGADVERERVFFRNGRQA